MKRNGFLIAAPQSGSGKTTVSLAIMAALRQRGLSVAPFKCGPDFIDPGYHRQAAGLPSVNLDGWMCPESYVVDTFGVHANGADVAIIEGVMGLFDGIGGSLMQGSSAQIAAVTGAPVVLVVNARGMAASAAPLVAGFAGFDARVKLAGVIFNNVGSASHGDLLRQVMAEHLPDVALLGCIPRNAALEIPSRHLGLVTVEDNPLSTEYLVHLAEMAEKYLDLDELAGLQIPPGPPFAKGGAIIPLAVNKGRLEGISPVRIAVARDAAFCFVYEDNLRLLREAGAEIVPFSPLEDRGLPPDISGIYLPGGYPELYADRLAGNSSMLESIKKAVDEDMPVYAECGGFIYLTEGMEPAGGNSAADFVGIFPVRTCMLPKRKALGYRQVEFITDTVIGTSGISARGHEFHYSEISPMSEHVERCYRVIRQGVQLGAEGYRFRNCLGSYIHLHFGSNPAIAQVFAEACKSRRSMLQTGAPTWGPE